MKLFEIFKYRNDASFLEEIGDWILAQYYEYDLDQKYSAFIDGFYKAIERADSEFFNSMKKVHTQLKNSPKKHIVGDDYDFHNTFNEGDEVPLIDDKVISYIYGLIQSANDRYYRRNQIKESEKHYRILNVDVNMGDPARPTSLKQVYRINSQDLVKAFGQPQKFTDPLDDINYLWDISIDYNRLGVKDEDEGYEYMADVQLYTRKYKEGLPPLSEEIVWNLGTTNDFDPQYVFEELLDEKGVKYKYIS